MRAVTAGILAHVDAGKTTCIESMLVDAGMLKKAGRVDHQDAFLDYDPQERERGITIYSKQAGLPWKDAYISLIDTPGHADFSAEMERTLSILDAVVLLISGSEGVQSHTRTIWKCLQTYNIPTIVFVSKMDISHFSKEELMKDLSSLSDVMVDMKAKTAEEEIALSDDRLLEAFTQRGKLDRDQIQNAFKDRAFFPVYFGSALKNEGVCDVLDALVDLVPDRPWPEAFGARVFKITRDETSVPLTHMKLTGGSLQAKAKIGEDKVDQIRIYQGNGYQSVPEASAGQIITVKGLHDLHPGDGLGFEANRPRPLLSPCLYYALILPADMDPVVMMGYLRDLMLEDPSLSVEFDEASQAISIRLMGEIQKEVLQRRIYEKAGCRVEFGPGKIIYKETIAEPVFGYGHFEPLRHYAEVHLLLEPGKRNEGMSYSSKVSRDVLSLNWQRQILSALARHTHKGMLTGSALTDVKITLTAGRAHPKHTSSGDFAQAADRAVRQGLKKVESILLEPYLRFEILTPSSALSRILFELETRHALVEVEAVDTERMKISGRGPHRLLLNFEEQLRALGKGEASWMQESDGYDVCQVADEIIEEIGYDDTLDRWHPSASVFCEQGSGTPIPWDEVEERLHIPVESRESVASVSLNSGKVSEEELRKVFAHSGGSNQNAKKQAAKKPKKKTELSLKPTKVSEEHSLPTVLIVDGYNMIYTWPRLRKISQQSLQAAREELISLLINYQGYKGWSLMVVFDGWKRKDNSGSSSRRGSSSIIYTPTGVSADQFIEKKIKDLKGKFSVVAATSDGLIQTSALSHGARRMSASELERAVFSVNEQAFAALKK